MAVEVYIPNQASFAGKPLDGARVLTLYDADSDRPHGAMTLSNPPQADTQGGPLEVHADRDGEPWRITLEGIHVRRSTAVGMEFDIVGPVSRSQAISDPK